MSVVRGEDKEWSRAAGLVMWVRATPAGEDGFLACGRPDQKGICLLISVTTSLFEKRHKTETKFTTIYKVIHFLNQRHL